MKGKKNLLVAGLLAALVLTGCEKKPVDPTPGPGDGGQTETRKVASVSLNKQTLTLEEEGSETLIATIAPANAENQSLKWESSNEEVAMVSSLGKVRALKAGTATITVSSLEDSSKKDQCVVTVTAKDRTVHVTGVTLNVKTLSLDKGEKEGLIATVAPNNATNKEVRWTSDTPTVATVSETGLVSAIARGTATITVASVEDPTRKDECVVTVIDNYVPVETVAISSADSHYDATTDTLELQDVDRPLGQLTVSVKGANNTEPTNARVSWSVQSGADVVTVSSSGQVTALKQGDAVVKATSEDDATKYDTVNIHVIAESEKDHTVHVDSIAWGTDLPTSLNLGEEKSFSVSVSPSNTNYTKVNVTFEGGALDNSYATLERVSNNVFRITAKQAVGQVTLVANAEDQVKSPAPIQANINIVDPITHVETISLDASLAGLVLFKGDQLDLVSGGKFEVLPATATNKAVSFNSSNEEVLLVSAAGKLTARAAGKSTITIRSLQDTSVYSEFEVTVKNIQVDRIDNVPANKTLEKGDTFTLEPEVVFKDGSKGGVVSYVSDKPTIVSVNENGLLTALNEGNAIITVTAQAANSGDPVVAVTCAVKVEDNKPVLLRMDKPISIKNFESRTQSTNLDSTDDLYNKSNLSKGNFFEGSADELMYKVGDKGLFKFNPVATARYSDETEKVYEGEIEYTRTLEVYNGASYEAAAQADYDNEEDGIRFHSSAVGKQFKLTVAAAESDDYNLGSINPSTLEFKVVAGYNAYSLAELSLFSNVGVSSEHPIDWESYRTSNGVTASVSDANGGIVLHNDIVVKEDIIPAGGLFTKNYWDQYLATTSGQNDLSAWMGTMGISSEEDALDILYDSPKDFQTLLERDTNSIDEDFTLEGNFFSINMSSLKPIVKAEDDSLVAFQGGDGSHAQFFGINSSSSDRARIEASNDDMFAFRNFQIIGNGSIATTDSLQVKLAKGGLIGIKHNSVKADYSNIVAHGLFIAFMPEAFNDLQVNKGALHMERTKAYDLYSSVFYFFGTQNNVIEDSWFTQSSGPLFFMDEHFMYDDSDHIIGVFPVYVDCENIYAYNPVQGDEPWFQSHAGSSMLVQDYLVAAGDPTAATGWIAGLANAIFSNTELPEEYRNQAKTVTSTDNGTDKYINFIAADINAHNFADNVYSQLLGHININNGTYGYAHLDMTKTAKTDLGDGANFRTELAPTVAPIIIQGSNGGTDDIAYINAADQQPVYPAGSNAVSLATSNYMSYYLDPVLGMAHSQSGYFIGILLCTYNFTNWLPYLA